MTSPTSPELEAIKTLKQIAREEFILPGTTICGGCGGLEALRLAVKVLGPKTVFVNAAGCFTLLTTFPYTPFKGSWLYTTMASAAAGAQGVRDALDVLIARGKLPAEDDVEVVVVAGDGSTYDMALSATLEPSSGGSTSGTSVTITNRTGIRACKCRAPHPTARARRPRPWE